MVISNEFLINYRQIIRLYEDMLKVIQQKYDLTKIEVDIISFLHNNPKRNTARDISEFRLLKKGNVSHALDLLVLKDLLTKSPRSEDRRIISLFLTKNTSDLTEDIDKVNLKFQKQIFENFTDEDIKLYALFNKNILSNISEKFEGDDFSGK